MGFETYLEKREAKLSNNNYDLYDNNKVIKSTN